MFSIYNFGEYKLIYSGLYLMGARNGGGLTKGHKEVKLLVATDAHHLSCGDGSVGSYI